MLENTLMYTVHTSFICLLNKMYTTFYLAFMPVMMVEWI